MRFERLLPDHTESCLGVLVTEGLGGLKIIAQAYDGRLENQISIKYSDNKMIIKI